LGYDFSTQTKTAVADEDGKWRVVLDPMDAVKLKSVNEVPAGKTMVTACEKGGKKAISETGMAVTELEFEEEPVHKGCSKQPALHGGKVYQP